MKNEKIKPKWLIVLLLSILSILSIKASAQTEIIAMMWDGSDQSFFMYASGKLSFDVNDLLISETATSAVFIPMDDIRKLVFPSNHEPIEDGIYTSKTDSKNIYIYPNPTNSSLRIANVSAERVSVAIFSINGQLLMKKESNASDPIDVSHLSQGFYLIKINNTTLKFNKL